MWPIQTEITPDNSIFKVVEISVDIRSKPKVISDIGLIGNNNLNQILARFNDRKDFRVELHDFYKIL